MEDCDNWKHRTVYLDKLYADGCKGTGRQMVVEDFRMDLMYAKCVLECRYGGIEKAWIKKPNTMNCWYESKGHVDYGGRKWYDKMYDSGLFLCWDKEYIGNYFFTEYSCKTKDIIRMFNMDITKKSDTTMFVIVDGWMSKVTVYDNVSLEWVSKSDVGQMIVQDMERVIRMLKGKKPDVEWIGLE